ncbi:MAG: hypothetical protein QNJ16_05940 [Rhodobacter sp.]|nr:hypothetical protein [Rhodobacter sp.]
MRDTTLKIYLHLPKCGGTTFAANVLRQFGSRCFHYISAAHLADLHRHIDTGFGGIDVVLVHSPDFPYDAMPRDIDVEYLAVCREPISAVASMYNFATNAAHSKFYPKVKGLGFWQFVAYSHKINIWHPNFQSYYLCGNRRWDAVAAFIEEFSVQLFTLDELDWVFRRLTGQGLDPTLDRNRAPTYHALADPLAEAASSVGAMADMVSAEDFSDLDRRLLEELFDTDQKLWRAALNAAQRRETGGRVAPAPSGALEPAAGTGGAAI